MAWEIYNSEEENSNETADMTAKQSPWKLLLKKVMMVSSQKEKENSSIYEFWLYEAKKTNNNNNNNANSGGQIPKSKNKNTVEMH